MRTDFLCISVFMVASGPRVKLASCKSALTLLLYPLHPPPRKKKKKKNAPGGLLY